LRQGREAGDGVAAAAAEPSSDQASRPAVEACVFRTGTALSISLSLARASSFEIARALLRTEASVYPVPSGLGWRRFKQVGSVRSSLARVRTPAPRLRATDAWSQENRAPLVSGALNMENGRLCLYKIRWIIHDSNFFSCCSRYVSNLGIYTQNSHRSCQLLLY
jgi:hypothetical protein